VSAFLSAVALAEADSRTWMYRDGAVMMVVLR